jgi:hypothetical protein
MDSSYSDL